MEKPILLSFRSLRQIAETIGSSATIWDGSGSKPEGIYTAYSEDRNGNKARLYIRTEKLTSDVDLLRAFRNAEIVRPLYTHGSGWSFYSIHEFINNQTKKWTIDSNIVIENYTVNDVYIWLKKTVIYGDGLEPIYISILDMVDKRNFGFMLFITKEEQDEFIQWFIDDQNERVLDEESRTVSSEF